MSTFTVSLVQDFDDCPSGREWIRSDPNDASGERFREEFLKPALAKHDKIVVDLNEADSLPPSFLDEALGKLAGEMGRSEFERRVEVRLTDDRTALRKLTESIDIRA